MKVHWVQDSPGAVNFNNIWGGDVFEIKNKEDVPSSANADDIFMKVDLSGGPKYYTSLGPNYPGVVYNSIGDFLVVKLEAEVTVKGVKV